MQLNEADFTVTEPIGEPLTGSGFEDEQAELDFINEGENAEGAAE